MADVWVCGDSQMRKPKGFRSPNRENTANKNPIPHLRGEVKWGENSYLNAKVTQKLYHT